MSTTTIKMTVTETLNVPAGTTIDIAPSGQVGGLRLPDGRLLRSWVMYEVEEADGSCVELSYDEMCDLDFDPGIEFTRDVEADLPVTDRQSLAA